MKTYISLDNLGRYELGAISTFCEQGIKINNQNDIVCEVTNDNRRLKYNLQRNQNFQFSSVAY